MVRHSVIKVTFCWRHIKGASAWTQSSRHEVVQSRCSINWLLGPEEDKQGFRVGL